MMNVGIKNAILLLLIIFILHFLVMNMITDKQIKTNNGTTSNQEPSKLSNDDTKDDKKEPFECETKKDDDLLAYVMQGESGNQTEWVDSNDAKFEKEMPIVCDTKNILDPEPTLPPMKPKVSSKVKFAENNNNFLVIQEYENESGLNGGKFFDGLCGFDEYSDTFQTVQPCN